MAVTRIDMTASGILIVFAWSVRTAQFDRSGGLR